MDIFSSLTMPELRLQCLQRNLTNAGTKPVLLERLAAHETAVTNLPDGVKFHGIFTIGKIKMRLSRTVRETIGLESLTQRSNYWAKVTISPVENARDCSKVSSKHQPIDYSPPIIMLWDFNAWCILYGYEKNLIAMATGKKIQAYIPVEEASLRAVKS